MFTQVYLANVEQTGREMRRLARAYAGDMSAYVTATWPEAFDALKAIPYRFDPKQVEFLQRPYYTLTGSGPGGDCDDKAVCVGALSELKGNPYRFVAVSRSNKPLHHVFAEVLLQGVWTVVDPTYSYHVFGQRIPYAQRKVIG